MTRGQNTEIRVVPNLSDEQEEAILRLGDIWQMEVHGLSWRPKQEHIVRYVDGTMAAKASVLKHSVAVNSEDVPVGGVGGVITLPAFQGEGHATAVLKYLAGYLRDQLNLPFGLLFCRPALVPFYRRLDWQLIADTVNIQQPQGTIASPIPVMYASFSKLSWPKGTVNLNSEPW